MSEGREVVDAVVRLAADRGGVPSGDVVARPTSSGALIAVAGEVVVKLHRVGTDQRTLAARVRLFGDPAWQDCLLVPVDLDLVVLSVEADDDGAPVDPAWSGSGSGSGSGLGAGAAPRLASVWPLVETVARDPDGVPWARAGELLARLHSRPLPEGAGLPPHGAVSRLKRALAGLAAAAAGRVAASAPSPDHAAARAVIERAAASLPAEAWEPSPRGRPVTVVHGDWHLGQMGRLARDGGREADAWRLIDADDLGLGDPAWDFARPAALMAAGILPATEWQTLLDAYRAAGGPALPPAPAEPWPALDAVARAGVVQGAAAVVRRAIEQARPLDDVDESLVDLCGALAGPS
ncbi:MAG TPA: phosphotransferase [Actinotalea sp.]|nr:phosphotransferase [Actinotalea sp.]